MRISRNKTWYPDSKADLEAQRTVSYTDNSTKGTSLDLNVFAKSPLFLFQQIVEFKQLLIVYCTRGNIQIVKKTGVYWFSGDIYIRNTKNIYQNPGFFTQNISKIKYRQYKYCIYPKVYSSKHILKKPISD